MSNTVNRKIHFFRIEFFESQAGSSNFRMHSDPINVIENITKLNFMGDHQKSRFKYYQNNDVSFLNEISTSSLGLRGKFALSRRSSLPELETEGVLKPLIIPANSGLAEITHFVYFPQKNVVGVEFNFFGPRATSLGNYLLDKSSNFNNRFEYIKIVPILNQDVDNQLSDMGEVNLFTMEVARNELALIEELDRDLYSAFDSAAKVTDEAESVELVLRKKKYSRGGFTLPFSKEKLKSILSIGDNRQKFNKLKVDAQSRSEERNKVFDLLEDKMITSKKVTTLGGRSRSVDSESMFEKIEEAYNDLESNF
ncbi:hypothetical protein [Bacillus solitudinis]|uniref:hypothetical protein n=1 Tax=Bacillus solitudinis TaxID=2014074 RepID=UPI000C245163|nr:hypothetical protein [Bacillus solitudinis]